MLDEGKGGYVMGKQSQEIREGIIWEGRISASDGTNVSIPHRITEGRQWYRRTRICQGTFIFTYLSRISAYGGSTTRNRRFKMLQHERCDL